MNRGILDRRGLGAQARRFRAAKPFPHAVIDDFLPTPLCSGLDEEFPAYDAARFRNEAGQPGKATHTGIRKLGPSFRALDEMARSSTFLARLEILTGIPGLRHDPEYFGGGAQENMEGMRLWPHIDFNRHPHTGFYRRLNLLVYLNKGWVPKMGGFLVLHRGPNTLQGAVRVPPLFNRCVIFATGRRSWHSVEPVRQLAARRGRRCVSLYFYTRKPASARWATAHQTIWRYPPLPKAVRPSAVLNAAIIEGINRALALRDLERASCEGRGRLRWVSPVPQSWTPGYGLTDKDVRWLRHELEERERRLDELWRRGYRYLVEAMRLYRDPRR